MLTIDRILYPTDFSRCSSHALPHTLHLAKRCEAELHLLHALVLHEADPSNAAHPLPHMEELYGALEEQAHRQMDATVAEHGKGFTIKRAQVRGVSAAGVILDDAGENELDLIAVGTHGRRGIRRLLLGSVAEEVVRLAPCPVLTVPERELRVGLSADSVERIVVPVDFSDHARLALNYANALAAFYRARLSVLHVVDEVVYPDFYPPVIPSGGLIAEELREQSETRLGKLVAEIDGAESRSEVFVRAGRAAPVIGDFAGEQEADLIVIASHGLTGISHMLLGSVTEQVIRRAACPVFTVKSFGKKLLSG